MAALQVQLIKCTVSTVRLDLALVILPRHNRTTRVCMILRVGPMQGPNLIRSISRCSKIVKDQCFKKTLDMTLEISQPLIKSSKEIDHNTDT